MERLHGVNKMGLSSRVHTAKATDTVQFAAPLVCIIMGALCLAVRALHEELIEKKGVF